MPLTAKSEVAAVAAIMALTGGCSMQESCPDIEPGWRLRILNLATETVRERERAAGVELPPNTFSSRCCSVSLTPHSGVLNALRNIDTLATYSAVITWKRPGRDRQLQAYSIFYDSCEQKIAEGH